MTLDLLITLVGNQESGYRGIHVRWSLGGRRRPAFRATLSEGESLLDLLTVALAVIDRDARSDEGGTSEQLRIDTLAGAAA